MKLWILFLWLTTFFGMIQANADTASTETPTAISAPDSKDSSVESDKPFAPYWSGEAGLSYSNQPSQLGQGQIQRQLSLTAIYNFTESGTYMSVGAVAGRQMVEGTDSNYGQLNLEGGLGLDFFQPSLGFQFQRGESAFNSLVSTLTLDFQLWNPFTVGMIFTGGLQSQNGPLSQILGTADTTVEIDSRSWSSALEVEFVPWDFLTLSLTASDAFNNTYQVQDVKHTVSKPLNDTDQIPSLTLGADISFLTDFVLALSLQAGYENFPAGTVYSPILGKTVTFNMPTTENFTGLSIGLTYNFK